MNNEPVAWMNRLGRLEYEQGNGFEIPLYTHPAKTEEFTGGNAICPSCGCKSLYKTARSEWCVTHKCLWQKDYDLTLTDDVVNELWAESQEDGIAMQQGFTTQQHYFAHLILREASEK